MFLIPLLVIFLISICGGILFSVILINIGIIDVPSKYGWLNIVVLNRKSLKHIAREKTGTSQEEQCYYTAMAMITGEMGSAKTAFLGTFSDFVYGQALGSVEGITNVTIVGTSALSSKYFISKKSDIIVAGELENKLVIEVKPRSRGVSAVDSMPGGRAYGYQS